MVLWPRRCWAVVTTAWEFQMFPLRLLPSLEETGFFASDWRMSDDALFQLARILIRRKPLSILEIGPGMSSYLFFMYQRIMKQELDLDVIYHIVDQKGEWHDRFKTRMATHGFPFDSVWALDMRDTYYNVNGLDFGVMDLISIDGPGEPGSRDCDAALAFVDKHMGPNTVMVIDDTNRPREAHLVEWINARRLSRFGDLFSGPERYNSSQVFDTLFPKRNTTFITPV